MKNKEIKIIILEDEPAHAELIRRNLTDSQNGCNIIVAGTLFEFSKMVSYVQPDLVIADMNLPDGNALSLLQGNVEAQPWPVLLMTSFGDEELAVRALKSGRDGLYGEVARNAQEHSVRCKQEYSGMEKYTEEQAGGDCYARK
jgi:DNA-binding NtrC family response regulator